ncbi:hypothetical protein VNO77_25197 [Canavalia gladiata]|uniref:Uncharacterized protein n=1 Tax=Canavalia gladiata TaxID=3824 RepID=A0AAN9L882_CANGL
MISPNIATPPSYTLGLLLRNPTRHRQNHSCTLSEPQSCRHFIESNLLVIIVTGVGRLKRGKREKEREAQKNGKMVMASFLWILLGLDGAIQWWVAKCDVFPIVVYIKVDDATRRLVVHKAFHALCLARDWSFEAPLLFKRSPSSCLSLSLNPFPKLDTLQPFIAFCISSLRKCISSPKFLFLRTP